MQHDIEAIASRDLSPDRGAVTLTFTARDGSEVTLRMPHALANTLRDAINALNDEAMAAQAPRAQGLRAGAFRRCNTANLNVDATYSAILMEFDAGTPLRVGIAWSLDDAESLAESIAGLVSRARGMGQTQTRQ